MSQESGILDSQLVAKVFETAGRFAPDSLLVRVCPTIVTVVRFSDPNAKLHIASEWTYQFQSEVKAQAFLISSEDPTWIDPEFTHATSVKPASWLSENLLSSCRLDGRLAYVLAVSAKAQASEAEGTPNSFQLESVILNGVWRPLWRLPVVIDARPVGVLADTGDVVLAGNEGLERPLGIIWNS